MKRNPILSAFLITGMLVATPPLIAAQSGTTEDFLGHPVGKTFHTPEQAVSSLAYLPPPPVADSPEFNRDKSAYQDGYGMKGSERWKQATDDADLHVPNIAKIFSEPLGVTISAESTPTLYKMLGYILVDTGDYATKTAKEHYMRQRPFVYFHHHTCQPESEEAALRANGSYPSGHTADAQTIGLMLSQLRPERAADIMKRSYEFGQSRVICGAHWQSDVDAGRVVGAVEYARLQSIPEFRGMLDEAQSEITKQADLLSAKTVH
ncbi:non-specific acid phosphatase [Salmonella enterica subsp. enterica serovar Choleraesuis]|nr:non-specific acid phosphatase [Salmonella enterica subsp. enterica serovar Choleraesuis]